MSDFKAYQVIIIATFVYANCFTVNVIVNQTALYTIESICPSFQLRFDGHPRLARGMQGKGPKEVAYLRPVFG